MGRRLGRSRDSDSGDAGVKLVIAIIQPSKLSAVREALEKIEVARMTICDAQGFGRQRGQEASLEPTESGPGNDPRSILLRKIVLEVVVNDDFLDRAIEMISSVARTGSEGTIGDGKIFIMPAQEAVQVNDGTRGLGAV
jgi:nitrogen regulatory protein PII